MFSNDRNDIIETIIDGSQPSSAELGSCVSFVSKEKKDAVLNGFTLTRGSGTKTYNDVEDKWFRTGGGILINYSSPTITNNIIRNNKCIAEAGVAGAGGGGIRMGFGKPVVVNNVISDNIGGYAGGIMIAFCSGSTIHNNVVVNNRASGSFNGGGGIYIDWRPITMTNMTIVNNHSGDKGGGIISTGTTTSLINCILYGNTASNGVEDNSTQIMKIFGGNARISYSCIEGGFDGLGDEEGAIMDDPLLLANFYLSENSPCIDAGNSDEKYNDNEDPNETGKALKPSLGTIRSDMGAYGGASVEEVILISKDLSPILQLDFIYSNPYHNDGIEISSIQNRNVNMSVYSLSGQLIKSERGIKIGEETIIVDLKLTKSSYVIFKDDKENAKVLKLIKL